MKNESKQKDLSFFILKYFKERTTTKALKAVRLIIFCAAKVRCFFYISKFF